MEKDHNKPKLLYRLDKRNIFYVAFDLAIYLPIAWIPIVFAIPNFVFDISLFSVILNILCAYLSFIIFKILYSVIFFNYIEIYEDRVIYKDVFGFKFVLQSQQIDRIFSYGYCGTPESIAIFKKSKFKIFPSMIISSLTFKQENEIRTNIIYLETKHFDKKDTN